MKLRHCTDLFTKRFLPWSLPRVGSGIGERYGITPGYSSDTGGNSGKRVRLTRKTRPGVSVHSIPDPGHPTPRRWKRLRPPLPPKEWEVRWASLAIFFLALGLGEFCTVYAWNLLSEGTGVGLFPAGQSSQRGQCTGTDPFKLVARCTCMDRHACVTHSPYHHHHHLPSSLPSKHAHHTPHTTPSPPLPSPSPPPPLPFPTPHTSHQHHHALSVW